MHWAAGARGVLPGPSTRRVQFRLPSEVTWGSRGPAARLPVRDDHLALCSLGSGPASSATDELMGTRTVLLDLSYI